MSATIDVAHIQATLDNWLWSSEDKGLEKLLNAMLPENGPSGSDPDPEYHAARAAADYLGGRVLRSDPVESDPDLVY